MSGLQLNADKTEIVNLGQASNLNNLSVDYMGQNVKLSSIKVARLNGIYISTDRLTATNLNYDKVKKGLLSQLGIWRQRALTLLGS